MRFCRENGQLETNMRLILEFRNQLLNMTLNEAKNVIDVNKFLLKRGFLS